GDLFRLRLAADRDDVLGDLVRALAGQPGVGLHVADRVGEARVDVVHRDPVRAEGAGQRLGERAQAALGGGVRQPRRAAAPAVRAVHVHDPAPAPLAHAGGERLRQVPRRGQLLVEVAVPVLVGRLPEVLVQSPGGVAHVDVDVAERLLGLGLEVHDRRLVRCVAEYDDGLGAERLRLLLDLVGLFRVRPGVDDDVRAAGGELEHDRLAQVAAGTGHEQGLPRDTELIGHGALCLIPWYVGIFRVGHWLASAAAPAPPVPLTVAGSPAGTGKWHATR